MDPATAAKHDTRADEADPRSCPPSNLLRIMHRMLLLCPVMGLPNEYESLCIKIPSSRRPLPSSPSSSSSPPPPQSLAPSTQRSDGMYTWKALGSRIVTIIKVAPTTTVLWDHQSNTAFKAAPSCALGPGCPVGTSMLAQVVMDFIEPSGGKPELWHINVLVFDIQTYGHDTNFLTHPQPAEKRYALLRSMSDDHPESCVFVSECMKVQWAGQLDALVQFHRNEGPSLSHIIDCYMRLGDDDPSHMSMVIC